MQTVFGSGEYYTFFFLHTYQTLPLFFVIMINFSRFDICLIHNCRLLMHQIQHPNQRFSIKPVFGSCSIIKVNAALPYIVQPIMRPLISGHIFGSEQVLLCCRTIHCCNQLPQTWRFVSHLSYIIIYIFPVCSRTLLNFYASV